MDESGIVLIKEKMMNLPSGKGMFVWQCKHAGVDEADAIHATGTAAKVVSECKKAGISHVIVKCLSGTVRYNQRPIAWDSEGNPTKYVDDLLKPWVETLHKDDIKVYGFQYLYLLNPAGEGEAALRRVDEMGLDGLHIDAEGEAFKNCDDVLKYTARLVNAPFPISLCSYRFPVTNQINRPYWNTLLAVCHFVSPQVYWEQAHNAAEQLLWSYQEYHEGRYYDGKFVKGLGCDLPFLPVGSAYKRGEWSATAGEIIQFLDKARELGCPSASIWEWYQIKRYVPHLWSTIANYQYDETIPEEPEEPGEYSDAEKLIRLWEAHPELHYRP